MNIKTTKERLADYIGCGSIDFVPRVHESVLNELRIDEVKELRKALVDRDAKLAALEEKRAYWTAQSDGWRTRAVKAECKLAALEMQEPFCHYRNFDEKIQFYPDETTVPLYAAAGAAPVPPTKWAPEEIERGYVGIRWVTKDGVHGRPTEHDVREYLTAMPETARCDCESCKAAGAAPVPEGWLLVKRDDLEELHSSINGDCYRGQEWEIKAIEAMLTPKEPT